MFRSYDIFIAYIFIFIYRSLRKSLQIRSAQLCRRYMLLTSSVLSATSKQCFELTSSVSSTTSKLYFEQSAMIYIEYINKLSITYKNFLSLFLK